MRAPRIFTSSPSAISRRRTGLQLAPSGGVEGEPAHEVAHGDRLAEARHEVEHPAVETCLRGLSGFRYEDGGAGGGT